MSLCIDSRYITGIYALGQWFKVKKSSVEIDAYEFTNWESEEPYCGKRLSDHHYTDYAMGCLYPDPPELHSFSYPNSRGESRSPSGCHGICFIDAETGERVSFSLMEVRAFREDRK